MIQQAFRFETGALSDPGLVRDENEDNWFVDEAKGVWLVADGMGGHTNGKLASTRIVDCVRTIGAAVSAPDLLARFTDRLMRANGELLQVSTASNAVLGSTVVAILVFGNQFACTWAGDSRAYLARNGKLHQISRDHTEVQELLDKGIINEEQALAWPRRNIITKAVGVFDDLELDTVHGQVSEGDRFLLCSDGLTGHVGDDEIYDAVSRYSPAEACRKLIDLTLERGAKDNVTVVIAHCRTAGRDTVAAGRQGNTIMSSSWTGSR
jgi:serine/threonine protein phosphatase PrpC